MKTTVGVNDFIRLVDYNENDVNAYAKITSIYDDGRIWITNMNMPFQGTISEIWTREEFDQKTNYQYTY